MAGAPRVTGNRDALPDEFLERLARIVPADRLADILGSFSRPKPVGLRFNPLVGAPDLTRGELEAAGLELRPLGWLPTGFTVPAEQRELLVRSDAASTGRVYIQNPSSMLAPWLLAAKPDEEVLDLAAAPGGKTTQLAVAMENAGRLAAVEAVRSRFFKLQANLQRCGVTNAHTYLADGRTIGGKTPERFDRVLLDAPCSSEARFRTADPRSFENWSSRKIREAARKQVGLLRAAIACTKVGGSIVYCTCSFAPEENEAVVDKVLRQSEGAVETQPIKLPAELVDHARDGLTSWDDQALADSLRRCARILPHAAHDAFFLCLLRKTATWPSGKPSGKPASRGKRSTRSTSKGGSRSGQRSRKR